MAAIYTWSDLGGDISAVIINPLIFFPKNLENETQAQYFFLFFFPFHRVVSILRAIENAKVFSNDDRLATLKSRICSMTQNIIIVKQLSWIRYEQTNRLQAKLIIGLMECVRRIPSLQSRHFKLVPEIAFCCFQFCLRTRELAAQVAVLSIIHSNLISFTTCFLAYLT